jgi:hypothetical protein
MKMIKKVGKMSLAIGIMVIFAGFSAHADNGWHFQLAPYLWMTGQTGYVATLPQLTSRPVRIDVPFGDVLKNLEGGIFLGGEVRKGRIGLMGDFMYVHIKAKDDSPEGKLYSSIGAEVTSSTEAVGLFYRVIDKDETFLDVLGGYRFWMLDTDLDLHGRIFPSRSFVHRETWSEPFIGLRGAIPFSEKWYGDLMAVGPGWDISGNVGYHFTNSIAGTLGWRYMFVDYEHGDFKYQVVQNGPVIGLVWRF